MRLSNIIFLITSNAITLFLHQWSPVYLLWRKNNFQDNSFINKKKCLIFWKHKGGLILYRLLTYIHRSIVHTPSTSTKLKAYVFRQHTFLDLTTGPVKTSKPPSSLCNAGKWCILDLIYVPQRYSTAIKQKKNSSTAGWQNLEGIHLWEVCNSEEDDLIT